MISMNYIFKKRCLKFILYSALVISSALMLVPFFWMISTSFKLEQFVFANPPQWIPAPFTLENYIHVFKRIPFPSYFFNSIFIASIACIGHVFFDTLAGYAFSKLKFAGRDKLFLILMMGLMVPFQVNIIPMYRIMAVFKWLDSYAALIVPQLTSIFGIFLMKQFISSIPDELLDAARMDGYSEFGIFVHIILPLSLPGIATLVIFTFMGIWNDFLWPRMVISSESLFTLPLGLAQLQARNTSTWGQIMAGTALTALPMIIIFLMMQKKFISGLTEGAVKQ